MIKVNMLSVAEAQRIILDQVEPCSAEAIFLPDALGRVAADNLTAQENLPPFDNSGMDGYAVRSSDVAQAGRTTPVTLKVVADIAAGHPSTASIGQGQAARIMTGAPVPAGADAIVPVEATDEPTHSHDAPGQIVIFEKATYGDHVRPAGGDVKVGAPVLNRGAIIRPAEIALLAALGCTQVTVIRRPRVAVLATGDELVQPGNKPLPGQIRNANGWGTAAQVVRYGGVPVQLGIARDTPHDLRAKLDEGLAAHIDLLVVSAGVSVGAHDLVKDVVRERGELNFWRVQMRPGKPLAFGRFSGIPFFGLPGNPVSAMLTFEQFVRPAILKMSGRTNWRKPTIEVELAHDVTSDGRETYARARVDREGSRYIARLSGEQASNVLSALVAANALVIIPSGQTHVPAGARVTAQMLDWSEDMF